MQTTLCDICGLPIRGEAIELQLIRGDAMSTEEGHPRIVRRGTTSMRYACLPCGTWIEQAIAHLGRSLREAGIAPTPHPLAR